MEKGMSYTLEALIAIGIVTTTLLFVLGQPTGSEGVGLTFAEENAFSCVQSLDREGRLREDAVAKNDGKIRDNLDGCIRGVFNHTVQVCKDTCTTLNLDVDEDVVSVRYYVPGYNTTDPAEVIAYLWTTI